MPAPETPATEPDPNDLVEAGCYPSTDDAFQHGLVVLALGAPCWIAPSPTGFRLLVEPGVKQVAREQLACFDRESVDWPPVPAAGDARPRRVEYRSPLVWCALVIGVYWAQGTWPGLTARGAVDSLAIFGHAEVWRALTALFLHADLGHLVANAFSGLFVFAAVLSAIGRLPGWLLLAGAGIGGNLAAAALRYPGPYRSIGASTAIFGGLGLLTGRAIRSVWQTRAHGWRTVFVPLASGLAVLGLYGAGGFDVDVLAHGTGFGVGLVLGVTASARRA